MKTLQMPLKYLQEKNILDKLINLTNFYGHKYLIITDDFIKDLLNERFIKIFSKSKKDSFEIITYKRDCTQKEIERILDFKKEFEIIVGLGGGKSIDIAKMIASIEDKPLIIIPTTASTDSATSALSVLYNEDGSLDRYVYHNKNPNIVLVDTELIVNAPIRYLVAGMGEALSTYYEAKACYDSKFLNKLGGTPSLTAITISKLALDIVLEKGLLAKVSAEAGIVNEAVDQVIEANLFMSGFGFENSGLGGAHAIHNGLISLPETNRALHGEKVAFGTIVQLVLENRDIDLILKIIGFCKSVGLPTRLKDLGIIEDVENKVRQLVKRTCIKGESIHNLPFEISESMVYNAIMVADKLGNYE